MARDCHLTQCPFIRLPGSFLYYVRQLRALLKSNLVCTQRHSFAICDIMGLPLPEKLKIPCAILGSLSIITFALRCFVRIRLVKAWGHDDSFITLAFVCLHIREPFILPLLTAHQAIHMWYTGTLLTGIHYGTGRRTSEISVEDSVHAMRVSR